MKKFVFNIRDTEVIDFCRVLGEYGVKFQIGKIIHIFPEVTDPFDTKHYRRIAVITSNRKMNKILNGFEDKFDF